jgi:hypothetical protein
MSEEFAASFSSVMQVCFRRYCVIDRRFDLKPRSTLLGYSAFALGMALSAPFRPLTGVSRIGPLSGANGWRIERRREGTEALPPHWAVAQRRRRRQATR